MKKLAFLFLAVFAVFALQAQAPLNWIADTDIEPFQESANVYEGNYSCGIIVNSGVQGDCDFDSDVAIAVNAGDTFKFSFWGYTSEFVRGRAKLIWSDGSIFYATTYLGPNTGGWEQFSVEGEIPAGITSVNVGIRFYDVAGFVPGEIQYVDAFAFESPSGNALTVVNGDFEQWPGLDPEPTNYPTDFVGEAAGLGAALSWIDAVGAQLPSGYLIKASSEDNITLPEDGTYVSDDLDLSDGTGAANVSFGEEGFTFPNLEASTTYYFKIFPYSNSGANVDYKTDGTPPATEVQTSDIVIINSENFDLSFGEWTPVNVLGDQVWDRDNSYGIGGTPCAKMSGYEGAAFDNEDWLISPPLALADYSNETLLFYSAYAYTGPFIELLISTDYDGSGNPNDFTWDDITDQALWPPEGSFFEWTTSGILELSAYTEQTIYVAFKFTSTTEGSATWEIDDIVITGEGEFTPDPEPTNYPTDFAANTTEQSILLTWTDAVGEQLPAGYVLMASTDNLFDLPIDGTTIENDADLSDGYAVLNLGYGIETCYFDGLPSNTTYYFTIFPFSNTGVNIDYKTDGNPPALTASTDAVAHTNLLYTTFDENWEAWEPISIVGDQVWDRDNTFGIDGTPCAKMTGYSGVSYENEDWLISPDVDLAGLWYDEQLIFNSARAYSGLPLEVKISHDYAGDPLSATWTDLSDQAIWPSGNPYFDWTYSGIIDISDWGDGNVNIAFVYFSTAEQSTTWELDNITVRALLADAVGENSRNTLRIFPNPGMGIFTIETVNTIRSIEVYSLTGALMAQQNPDNAISQIDLSELNPGIYFARISDNEGNIITSKIVIE